MRPGDHDSRNQPDKDKLLSAKELVDGSFGPAPSRWLWVDVARQRLVLVEGSAPRTEWPVSTARAGLDGRQDSQGTPPGLHRIDAKIGAGEPSGAVYRSRRPTGEVWPDRLQDAAPDAEDLILTRILTLDGLQDGLNRGPGCDSRERYIYFHGTNHESEIGTPASHGCVRLRNDDMLDLFARVEAGDPVVIL